MAFLAQMRETAEMIKISHSVFGLPFALGAAALAMRAEGRFSAAQAGWIVFCAVMARTAAMTQNRLVDARLDSANPRTRGRALPAGRVSTAFVAGLVVLASALFVVGAGMLNRLCLFLSPVVLVVVLGYPFSKRFTALCHLWLGVALGLAPVGAWVAVRGSFEGWPVPALFGAAVMLWTAGFDCIYACQDADHDRAQGLFSIPARFGVASALAFARVLHGTTVVLLVAAGVLSPYLGWPYYAAVGFTAALLAYENSLVKPGDLSRVDVAFFTLNGVVSLVVGAAIIFNASGLTG
ncbi:MAG: UbiA-like polyprenyltransferase [Planctomycetota bacterium]